MADKKISALTAASVPLAGSEVLPIVQGGVTVKVSASDLTAGRQVLASAVSINTSSAAYPLNVAGVIHNNTYAFLSHGAQGASSGIVMGGLGANYGRIYEASNDVWSLGYGGSPTGTPTAVVSWNGSGNATVNTGDLIIGTAGKGVVLTSPNGLVTKTLTIDNAGNIALI